MKSSCRSIRKQQPNVGGKTCARHKPKPKADNTEKETHRPLIIFKGVYGIFYDERNVHFKLVFTFQWAKFRNLMSTVVAGVGKETLLFLLGETKLVQASAGEFGDIYQNENHGSEVQSMLGLSAMAELIPGRPRVPKATLSSATCQGPHIPWMTMSTAGPSTPRTWSSALPDVTVCGLPDGQGWSGFRELAKGFLRNPTMGGNMLRLNPEGATMWPSSFRKQPAANEKCGGWNARKCISLEHCDSAFKRNCTGRLLNPNDPEDLANSEVHYLMGPRYPLKNVTNMELISTV